jgi:zinc transport system substrate-binding protein
MVQTAKHSSSEAKVKGMILLHSRATIIRGAAMVASVAFIAVIFFWLVYPSGCLAGQKLQVVTSLFPLQEMARAVGGDRVSVSLLLPPGAEPHAWEPKPSDIVTLTKADIFIYLGSGMEPWAQSILQGINRQSLKVIEARQGLPAIANEEHDDDYGHDDNHDHDADHDHHNHGPMDPHFWLDFSYDQIMVSQIAKAFSEQDPAGAKLYTQNAAQYQKKLAELDRKYQNVLQHCQNQKIFLGGHAAFAYLAKRYHLEQVPLYGICPDAEPSPKRLAQVADLAKKLKIKTIFFEELVSDRMAKVLAKEVGAGTLTLNPGANVTIEQIKSGVTFISLMEKNLENLTKGLGCE